MRSQIIFQHILCVKETFWYTCAMCNMQCASLVDRDTCQMRDRVRLNDGNPGQSPSVGKLYLSTLTYYSVLWRSNSLGSWPKSIPIWVLWHLDKHPQGNVPAFRREYWTMSITERQRPSLSKCWNTWPNTFLYFDVKRHLQLSKEQMNSSEPSSQFKSLFYLSSFFKNYN